MSASVDERLRRLADLLAEEARAEVPPFGAQSLKLAGQLGTDASGLLLERVGAGNQIGLLALEALRRADPPSYHSISARARADAYAAALVQSRFFNAWGLPGYQLTATARALVALGGEAVAALRPLLFDRRAAFLVGSQDATTSQIYGNRVCDYAWVLIQEAQTGRSTYPRDPAERDAAIERWLQDVS